MFTERLGIWSAEAGWLPLVFCVREEPTSKHCLPPNEGWTYPWQGTNHLQIKVDWSCYRVSMQGNAILFMVDKKRPPVRTTHWVSFDVNHLSMQYFLAQIFFFFFSQPHIEVLSQGLLPFAKACTQENLSLHIIILFWHLTGFGNLLFLIPKSLFLPSSVPEWKSMLTGIASATPWEA